MIGVGGTAGHVVPAIAVADVLRDHGARVVFAGGDRFERELVPAAGYELRTLKVAPLARRRPAEAARAAAVDFGALGHAMRLIGELSPDVVLGAGGYVAGPVGLAGALRRTPLVLMEADSHLGITNRWLAPMARRVCLAFAIDGRDSDRYRITGRPVPPPATDRAAARAAVRPGARRAVRARVRRLTGGTLDQPRRDRGVRRRGRAGADPACGRHP